MFTDFYYINRMLLRANRCASTNSRAVDSYHLWPCGGTVEYAVGFRVRLEQEEGGILLFVMSREIIKCKIQFKRLKMCLMVLHFISLIPFFCGFYLWVIAYSCVYFLQHQSQPKKLITLSCCLGGTLLPVCSSVCRRCKRSCGSHV